MSLLDLAGWAGGIVLLAAYVLISRGGDAGDGATYQVLNVVGGALLTASALHAHAMPNVAMNLVWVAAGSITLALRSRRRRRVAHPASAGAERRPPVDPVLAAEMLLLEHDDDTLTA